MGNGSSFRKADGPESYPEYNQRFLIQQGQVLDDSVRERLGLPPRDIEDLRDGGGYDVNDLEPAELVRMCAIQLRVLAWAMLQLAEGWVEMGLDGPPSYGELVFEVGRLMSTPSYTQKMLLAASLLEGTSFHHD